MYALFVVIFALPGAFAQGYGHGYYGALNCPQPYAAAPAAIDPNDLLRNNRGLVRQSQVQIGLDQRRVQGLNAAIAQERLQLQQILGPPVVEAIVSHQRFGRGPGDYAPGCAAPAVAGPPIPAGNLALPPSPAGFCQNIGGRVQNLWTTSFAGPGGRVSENICNMAPGFRGAMPAPRAQACRQHLNLYYQRLAEQAALEQRIAGLNQNVRTWQAEEADLINAQTAAQTCVDCVPDNHEWSAEQPLVGEVSPILSILQAFLGGGQGRNRGFGGGGFGGGYGPYPGQPYSARLRHYYGARGPQYGGVPGGVGAGAFAGCGGPGALGRGAQFAPPIQPALNQRYANPLGPQYGNDLLNPGAQNDLFNPGFGPGFAPNVGNGLNTAPRYLPALPATQFVPQPLPFAQTSPYVPVTQLGFGNLGQQLGPNRLIGAPMVQNVFRPPMPAPGVLPAVAQMNPGFAVGQPMPPGVGYGVLATQVNRAQYGLGVMQGGPGLPAALPLPGGQAFPGQYVRPPAPAVLPAIRSY